MNHDSCDSIASRPHTILCVCGAGFPCSDLSACTCVWRQKERKTGLQLHLFVKNCYNFFFLINPLSPPFQDKYQMFGQSFTADDAIIRPLEASGVRRLYPQAYDHKRELKKLNHSILVNFLDLIDILIRAPDSPKRVEKLEDLNLLFINMHHLINEYRPHQARETLRVMMEEQRKQRNEISDKFQANLDHVMQVSWWWW